MWVLSLTGSIGMGKSTASTMLRCLGVPMHDADASVHRPTGKEAAAVPLIDAAFRVFVKDAVDRQALGQAVFGDPVALKRLERILHPLVGGLRDRFLARARRERRRIVVFDVPFCWKRVGSGIAMWSSLFPPRRFSSAPGFGKTGDDRREAGRYSGPANARSPETAAGGYGRPPVLAGR